ncbi:hypothetical protein [Leeia aquatica]|uniref:Uncharacterized protein n=1 Tax=Leeia aquatica TaxID=2725557 RepID=A0A847S0G5_9NEIS|nr:hypothetical protein [Leeia aquatica]NLR75371.1 hypothetical protein [Leeia aquatica]
MIKHTFAILTATLSLATAAAEPIWTSIRPAECTPLTRAASGKMADDYQHCKGMGGWQLWAGSADSQPASWLLLGRGQTMWNTHTLLTNPQRWGQFAGLGADKVEWQQQGGMATGLIFRVNGQQDDGRKQSRLVALKLTPQAVQYCGDADTIAGARALLAQDQCSTPLPAQPVQCLHQAPGAAGCQ